MLSRYRLVLASPRTPGNVGSCARVAANFDLRDIFVVDPPCDPKGGEAPRFAVGAARQYLDRMKVVPKLEDALKDCEAAIGFTRREGRHRVPSLELPAVPSVKARRIALVFGNEETGLTREELLLCTHICSFPTSPVQPSLNLSHAVAVALARVSEIERSSKQRKKKKSGEVATLAEQEALFAHWRELMVDAGLTTGGNPERMLDRIRRILQRASLSALEVRVLRGFVSRIQKRLL